MAAIEPLVISKIIEAQSLVEAIRSGIKPAYFNGEWEQIYQFILSYNTEHGHVPSERAFRKQWGDVDIEDTTGESFSGLFEELLDSYRFRTVAEAMTEASGALDRDVVKEAMEALNHGLMAASADTARLTDFNLVETWEERMDRYQYLHDNPDSMLGISTGFASLDRILHGWQTQQFVVIGGEPKRGKSTISLIMAMAAQRTGYKPLYISFEMSSKEQEARHDAILAGVSHEALMSGNATQMELDKVRRALMLNKNAMDFIISEDASGLTTVGAVAAKAREYMPAILFVDGLYLMDDEHGEKKGSPQAITNITRGFKRLAQSLQIPIVGTTQVLPSKVHNSKTRSVTADAFGYSSSFAQDADVLMAAERDPDIDNQSILRIVEARNAPRAEIKIAWNWETMDFHEVDEMDDDDDFDDIGHVA